MFIPVVLDDLGIEDLAVMKTNTWAEGHLKRALIEPAPTGRKPRD
jgi:hypothetical protein